MKSIWTISIGQCDLDKLAEFYRDLKILATPSQQLRWSHFCEIISIKDDLDRDFYAEMCRMERWSVRTLRSQIDGNYFSASYANKYSDRLFESINTKHRAEPKYIEQCIARHKREVPRGRKTKMVPQ